MCDVESEQCVGSTAYSMFVQVHLSTVVLFISNFEFHNPVYMVYQ